MTSPSSSLRILRVTHPYLRGPDVAAVQRALAERSYDTGVIEGAYGPNTENAVRAFQSDHGVPVDGVVGPRTYSLLGIDDGSAEPGRPEPGTGMRTLIDAPNDFKMVALTFDDGPTSSATPGVLTALAKADVRATFFILGSNLAARPGLGRDIAAARHQLAVHSWDHVNLTGQSDNAVTGQLQRTRDAIASATGGPAPTWMRFPYGAFDRRVLTLANRVGLRWNVFWDVASRDETSPGVLTIVDRTVQATKNGSIILLHDLAAQTVSAVPLIIDRLRGSGYTFGTLEQLLQAAAPEE